MCGVNVKAKVFHHNKLKLLQNYAIWISILFKHFSNFNCGNFYSFFFLVRFNFYKSPKPKDNNNKIKYTLLMEMRSKMQVNTKIIRVTQPHYGLWETRHRMKKAFEKNSLQFLDVNLRDCAAYEEASISAQCLTSSSHWRTSYVRHSSYSSKTSLWSRKKKLKIN